MHSFVQADASVRREERNKGGTKRRKEESKSCVDGAISAFSFVSRDVTKMDSI